MAEKLVPPIKPVARADGLKQGTANTTLTTPNQPQDNKYWGEGAGSKDKIA